MDIMVESYQKIENSLNDNDTAMKWGLLTLCRIEPEFYSFSAMDKLDVSLDMKSTVDKCIAFVCDNTEEDFSEDSENIREFYEQICDDPDLNVMYMLPALENLDSYLEFLQNAESPESLAGVILSAIPEDYIMETFDIDLNEFSDNRIIKDELQRIQNDKIFIETHGINEIKERAEQYRQFNILKMKY